MTKKSTANKSIVMVFLIISSFAVSGCALLPIVAGKMLENWDKKKAADKYRAKSVATQPRAKKIAIDISSLDKNSRTPLHRAAAEGNLKLARLLINNGANISAPR